MRRVGRDTRDILNIVHEIEQRGASLKVLSPAIDTSGDMGKIVLTVLGMVAQMERTFIKERQRAGIEAAKVKGVYKGGKAQISVEQVQKLILRRLRPSEIGRRKPGPNPTANSGPLVYSNGHRIGEFHGGTRLASSTETIWEQVEESVRQGGALGRE